MHGVGKHVPIGNGYAAQGSNCSAGRGCGIGETVTRWIGKNGIHQLIAIEIENVLACQPGRLSGIVGRGQITQQSGGGRR